MRESIFSASMNNNENKLQGTITITISTVIIIIIIMTIGWSFFDEQALAHAIEKNNEKESKLKDLLL